MAIGVQVNISPGAGSPVISASPLNVVAMVVKSNKGPLGIPMPMTSIGDYEVKFGQPQDNTVGEFYQSYYAAKSLWGELGSGITAVVYGVRLGSGGVAASYQYGTTGGFSVSSAWQGYASPGTGGNSVQIALAQQGTTGRWNLSVYEKDPVGTFYAGTDQLVLRETYTDLTNANILNEVNTRRPSNYIVLSGTSITSLTGGSNVTVYLAGGTNPTVSETSVTTTALAVLDSYRFQYLIAPDFMDSVANSPTVCDNLATYATARGTSTAITCSASSYTWDTVVAFGLPRQKQMTFHTGYFGWFVIDDNFGTERDICPVGPMVGAYWIRKCQLDGNIAHSAPGGVTTPLRTIKKLQTANQSLTNVQIDTVRGDAGMNTVKYEPSFGYVVMTSRSFSTDSRFYNSHRNRSTNFLAASGEIALLYYNQRPNNETTRSVASGSLESFVSYQYDLGMFDTDGPRDQSYQVVCTASNNPAQVKTSRWMVIDLYVKYVEVNELVRLNIQQSEIGTQITIK